MTPLPSIHAHRSTVAVAALTALAMAVAACGGAPTPSGTAVAATDPPTSRPTTAATVPPTPTPSPDPTSAPTAAVTAAPVSPAAAHEPQSIHLILHATHDSVGSLSGCSDVGTCRGDYMIGDDPLFDATTGKQVGTFAYECFLVDVASTLYHCPGVTIALDGRGEIAFTEVIHHLSGFPPAVAPITGGSGEFLGATGFVISKKIPTGGDFVVTISK